MPETATAGARRRESRGGTSRLALTAVCLAASTAAALALPEPAEGCGGCGSGSFAAAFVRTFTNDDGVVDLPSIDPMDDGTDPGYDKAVAHCEARIVDATLLRVTLTNAYPSYTCTFWSKVRNVGKQEIRYRGATVRAADVLTVTDLTPAVCGTLKPGKAMQTVFSVHVEQPAQPASRYTFDIDLRYEAASCNP